jgi:hypothetical protein
VYNLESPSADQGLRSAISYGPFGVLQSLLVGFLLGCLVFVIGDALVSPDPGHVGDLPALLLCVGGGTALVLAVAMAENYRIGKAVRQQMELDRATFSGTHIPPPLFDENGDRMAAGTKRAGQARPHAAPPETWAEKQAAPANSDQRDRSAPANVDVAPELGGPGSRHR